MTTDALKEAPFAWPLVLPRALRLALTDLRGGLGGFYVFVACVALGVAVITGVGALSDGLRSGFERQGQSLLGGDLSLSRIHQEASAAEIAWMRRQGSVSEVATLRSMARRPDGSQPALVELKSVDGNYPLFGDLQIEGGGKLHELLAKGALVDQLLLDRMALKTGDLIRIGTADIAIAGVIRKEPDQIGERLPFGPRVLVSNAFLTTTGLVQPGSLVRWSYRIRFADGVSDADVKGRCLSIKNDLPEAGFICANRTNPSPNVSRSIERLRQFLTLIGLTSLLVGGVGVANAVSTFVDRKRKSIAIFKCVGASSRQVLSIFLIEVLLLAGLGVAIGMAAGMLLPPLIQALYGNALPFEIRFAISAKSLLIAAFYGFMVALAFMLWPLGRSEQVRASVLFREDVAPQRAWPRRSIVAATVALAIGLTAFAVTSSDIKLMALWFVLGTAATLVVFLGIGSGLAILAARVPRPRIPEIALALGNIGGPGSLTRAIVLSLGAGLSLLVAVGLVNASLVSEFEDRLPEKSPDYYVLDIRKGDWDGFAALVKRHSPTAIIEHAPMLRGRIVALGNRQAEQIKAPPEAQWVLNGDRGITFAEAVPNGSHVVEGQWWPKDYEGEPLVSFEAEIARRLGLKIGDTVVANVLGRNITARISNLREVKWENLTINFVMVYSPNTLKTAPYNLLATVTLPRGHTSKDEGRLIQEASTAYPSLTMVRVRDAISLFNQVFEKVMVAVRAAGGVTIAAGALVLAGAMATAQRRRIYQAVVLKAIGATRRQILSAHLTEYLLLALFTALVAAAVGTFAAYIVLRFVMEIPFQFALGSLLQALTLATGLVVAFGLGATWRVLGAPAVPYLKTE
jgi:putative ABC transport system permease protein